jgi:LysR family transcriptional regulator, glycine cleavage system transcriptional activator
MLTPHGQRLHQRASEAFALIADSSERWTEARGAAVVRLTSIPSVSSLWLMPRLMGFETGLETGDPALRVEFVVEHRNIDLEAEGIDLAIRCGRGGLPGRSSVRLFEEHCYPVAAPSLAVRIGEGAPERLLDFPLVHDSDASGWRAWFSAQGLDYRPRAQDRRFEDYNLVIDAAACGLGVALARPPLIGEALRTQRLVRVDPRTALNPVAYWLDRPQGRLRPAAAELARRIIAAAGLEDEAAEAFFKAQG